MRRYAFDYKDRNPIPAGTNGFYLLEKITQYGPSDADVLPPTTFSYDYDAAHEIKWRSHPGCWTYGAQRPFLHTIANGYGAQASFAYTAQLIPGTGALCDGGNAEFVGVLQKVQALTLTTTDFVAQRTYTYARPAYQIPQYPTDPQVWVKEFIGFGQVIEDLLDGSGTRWRRTETQFDNTLNSEQAPPVEGNADDPFKGQKLQESTSTWDGANWQEQTRTAYTYRDFDAAAAGAAGIAGWPAPVHFVYPQQVTTQQCTGVDCVIHKTVYDYDPAWQNLCGASAPAGYIGTASPSLGP